MPTLRLIETGSTAGGHEGDINSCAYTPDGAFVLTGGWDGYLRLWEASAGMPVTGFKAGDRPVCACTVSPDGKEWLSGGLDGLLASWDPVSQHRLSIFLAHPRPIGAIAYSQDGQWMATAAWDNNLSLWPPGKERDRRNLTGHSDIVAGCRFTPSGRSLLSWSYDHTVRLWEVTRARLVTTYTGHNDRVMAGAISPDGRWAATGSLDGELKLWDLQADMEAASLNLGSEIRGLGFLLDLSSLLAVTANGRVTWHTLPELQTEAELETGFPVQCADYAPSSAQIAMGGEDGHIHLVALEGLDHVPLLVSLTQSTRRTQTTLQRLIGKSAMVLVFNVVCPVCRHGFEAPSADPKQALACPVCKHPLRVNSQNTPS